MGTKSVLKLSPDFETPFILIGIASHENDYRISWALNTNLGFQFVKSENHRVFHKKFNELQEFSLYVSHSNNNGPSFKLLSNRCDNGFLLEDLKNIDFLMVVEEPDKLGDINNFVSQLKSISFISTAFVLNTTTLKNINRLK